MSEQNGQADPFVRVPVALIDEHAQHMGAVGLAVYLVLMSFARRTGPDKGKAWPSYGRIAKILAVDRCTVKRTVADLEQKGYIKVERCAGGNPRTCTNVFTLVYPYPVHTAPGAKSTRCKIQHDPVHKAPPTRCIKHPEPDEENQKKRTRGRGTRPPMVPPTADEVRDYCAGQRIRIDVGKFLDYYEAHGWQGIVNWQAAVRNWRARMTAKERQQLAEQDEAERRQAEQAERRRQQRERERQQAGGPDPLVLKLAQRMGAGPAAG